MPPRSGAGMRSSEGIEFDSTSSKLHLQLGHKQRSQTCSACVKPSYSCMTADGSDTVSPLALPVLCHVCLTLSSNFPWQFLSPSPSFLLSYSYNAPLHKHSAGFKPQQQDSWCRQTGEGRRDLEKALGYWAKTGERTVTLQPRFPSETDHDVHIYVCHKDNIHLKLHLWTTLA